MHTEHLLSSEEDAEQGGASLAFPTLERNEESEPGNTGPFPKSKDFLQTPPGPALWAFTTPGLSPFHCEWAVRSFLGATFLLLQWFCHQSALPSSPTSLDSVVRGQGGFHHTSWPPLSSPTTVQRVWVFARWCYYLRSTLVAPASRGLPCQD